MCRKIQSPASTEAPSGANCIATRRLIDCMDATKAERMRFQSSPRAFVLCFMCVAILIPSIVSAQATLAGVVKDSSGGVLPGVTVETSSPALIEKTRAATTDGTGQYQIVDLRPGTYAITFALSGFRTVTREGVEVSGAGVITIDANLSVGPLNETLTVLGETPVVDAHSVLRQ